MPDQYLQQLDRSTTAADTHLLPISDDPAGTGRLKAIEVGDLVDSIVITHTGIAEIEAPTSLPTVGGQVASTAPDGSFAAWLTPLVADGVAGGQTLVGGTGPAEILTLLPTSNANRGKLRVGGVGRLVFDDSLIRLGLGTDSPSARLHVQDGNPLIRRDPSGSLPYFQAIRGGVRVWSLHIDSTANNGSLYWAADGNGATYAVRLSVGQTRNAFEIQDVAGGMLSGMDVNGALLLPVFTDATRPLAGVAGRVIFNSDDAAAGGLNIDDGTQWRLTDGTIT